MIVRISKADHDETQRLPFTTPMVISGKEIPGWAKAQTAATNRGFQVSSITEADLMNN